MKVYLNKITGIDDAMVSMLMSKRSYTRAKEEEIRAMVVNNTNWYGGLVHGTDYDKFSMWMDKLIKYGVKEGHTTLLRFIDISFTVEGLHRAGQDDWDAHVARMDNRIVRASTRLGSFQEGEISDWYKDKIKFPFEVLQQLGIKLPENIIDDNGVEFVKTDYGYVREDLQDNQDAKRGLYPESIPSNFIFKVQYPELCHILQHRDCNGHANPEVKILAEDIKVQLNNWNWWLGENVWKVIMQPAGRIR
jgi:thymidylate synthase ThyX